MDNWPSGMNTLMWPLLSLSRCWTCLWSVSRPGPSEGLPDCLGALVSGPPLWVSIFNIFLSDSFPLAMGPGFLWDDLQYKKSNEKMGEKQVFRWLPGIFRVFYGGWFWTNILFQILKIVISPKSKQGKQPLSCKFENHKTIQSTKALREFPLTSCIFAVHLDCANYWLHSAQLPSFL